MSCSSRPLPGNTLSVRYHNAVYNEFPAGSLLGKMYTHFVSYLPLVREDEGDAAAAVSPLDLVLTENFYHCFLVFLGDDASTSTVYILHHLHHYPDHLIPKIVWDERWFLTYGETIGGNHTTYSFPSNLFDTVSPSHAYAPIRTQREKRS